jgi:ATP/maltotriose-dependent transcriptional regulator MalT
MIELGVGLAFQGAWDSLAEWSERAVRAAAMIGDPALTATALAVDAAGAALGGRGEVARRKRHAAALAVDALSDDQLIDRLDAPAYLALSEIFLDRYEDAGRHARRGLRLARESGSGELVSMMTANLGTSLWMSGRSAEAVELFEAAVESARLVQNTSDLVWTLFNSAYASFTAGDVELAFVKAEESWELAQTLEPGPISATSACALASVLLEQGQAARAAELFVTGAGGEELRMLGGSFRGKYLHALTRARLAAGRLANAERSAAAAEACGAEVDLPVAQAMAQLARAEVELAGGDPAAAGRQAAAAAAKLEGAGDVFDATRARVFAGRALAAAGQIDAAAVELERAARAFAEFGADRYRAEAERELRKLGRTVYRRSGAGTASDGVASLTERELQLALLVVDRKTNPQIAAELFLSQKTVESHLRNIFRKVGVANRVELARAVEQADRAAG